MTLQTFIRERSDQIEKIETASHQAWWGLATTGDPQYEKEFTEKKIALRTLFSNSKDFQFLQKQDSGQDPLIDRQKTLLLHQYRENQISADLIGRITQLETEVEATYTKFRPVVDGKTLTNNDVKKILIESTDSAKRQKVWKASKVVGEKVVHSVRQLIALRNDSAQMAGFPNFYSMRLVLQEIEEERLFALLHEIDQLTAPAWKQYKEHLDRHLAERYGIPLQALQPWHYHDPFFQEAPTTGLHLDPYYVGKDLVAIGEAFFRTIGLPVQDILRRSDLLEREGKHPHAFCMCIDRREDIRVLCNMRQNEYWMGTLLHELGHAVYDKYIAQDLPYILRTTAHISTTEASAMLFGRLSTQADFLQDYVGLSTEIAHEIASKAQKQVAAKLLVFARWALVMVHFERAMYQEPDRDLNRYWWDLVEKFQWMRRVPQRDQADWASKLHLACAPVYYQNYVLGEMTASQLLHSIRSGVEKTGVRRGHSRATGDFLRQKLYALGARYPWEETLRQATGEDLNPRYFALDAL